MDDRELKNLLKNNSKVPCRQSDEWSKILTKIESDQSLSLFRGWEGFKKASIAFTTFAMLSVIIFHTIKPLRPKQEIAKLDEIDTFLTAYSYFSESEGEYSWVEGL